MSTFREPVIGDELDLATYGRPLTGESSGSAAARAQADYVARSRERDNARRTARDHSAARARRFNSHRPRPSAENAAQERAAYTADGVRTVRISGQPTPARRGSSAGRSLAAQVDRYDRRPDRAAQWALFMGVFMIVVAIVTGT